MNSRPLLETRQLTYTYSNGIRALHGIDFQVAAGETVAVVGGSGCGKSTLAKICCRLLIPDSGDIRWEGRPSSDFSRAQWARHVQMVFQDPYASLNPKLTVGMQIGEVHRGGPGPAHWLERVGLPADFVSRFPHQLSGGQRQRVAIARALALGPRVLVADEPLSSLDSETQDQILGLLRALRETVDLALVLITHDLTVARHLTERVVVLQDGRVVEEGRTADVLAAPQQAYTRALVEAVL